MRIKEYIKVKLEFSPLLVIVFLVFLCLKEIDQLLYTFVFLIGHEIAHFLLARLRGYEVESIQILPFGIALKLKTLNVLSSGDEIIIALAGPAFNILAAVFFYSFIHNDFFVEINLVLGIFNLIPIFPLDGGRVLRAVILRKSNYIRATKAVCKLTRGISLILLSISAVCVVYSIYASIAVFIFAFILFNSYNTEYFTGYMGMIEFLDKKEELKKRQILRAIAFTAVTECKAKDVSRKLMTEFYNVIYILDNDMRVRYVLTETMLLDSMLKLGYNCTLLDIIKSLEDNENGFADR